MLIHDFIRTGQALLSNTPDPLELLRLVTDVADDTVKNFYRNVFVVELPHDGQRDVRVLPRQPFGQPRDRDDFEVNRRRALGAPITLPSGGNPLNAQGRYGLPAYPCYDRHLRDFQSSADKVREFLEGRLARTPALRLSPETIEEIARQLHETVRGITFEEKKVLGVLVLAQIGPGGFYTLGASQTEGHVGFSANGQAILPDAARILDAVLSARVEEGREKGERPGQCSVTREQGQLVSAYCKSWPWAFPTWDCPLPHGGDEKSLIESIALSSAAYRALTVGACVFEKLSKPLARVVLPEIFSPADNRAGKEQAQRKRDLPAILGSALLTPLDEGLLAGEDVSRDFADGLWCMLGRLPTQTGPEADRYFTEVAGFEVVVPEELREGFRLTLVYFSGEPSRGDVHLRTTIEDVLPSTLFRVRELARRQARQGMALLGALLPGMTVRQRAYLGTCYQSVPYLLARAYGGAYLWQQMEAILHRRPLHPGRVIGNAAGRIAGLVPNWPRSRFQLREEVGFLLHFLDFLGQLNRQPAQQTGENRVMATRHWKELVEALVRGPVVEMRFEPPSELGFACGLLVRRFSGWYALELGKDKDYLRDRVLTFGASLSPEDVWKRAMLGIRNIAGRYKKLHQRVSAGVLGYHEDREEYRKRAGDYELRFGAVLQELERQKDKLGSAQFRDEFMTGFWAGYSLLDHDRPRKAKKTETEVSATASEG
jgi:hypothetical protein